MPTVSPEVLASAKEVLLAKTKAWSRGICAGTCLDLEGNDITQWNHTACHSWMTTCFQERFDGYGWGSSYKKSTKPFLTLSCHSKERSRVSAEATDAIILWLAKESAFSEYFLNRDDDDSLLNGGAILLCGPGGLNLPQAMWVCKALRHITEGGKALETWLTLYKAGVNPMLAFLVASYVREVKGATFGYTGVESHTGVFDFMNEGSPDPVAVLNCTFNPDANSTSSLFQDWSGGKAKAIKTDLSVTMQGFCKPVMKSDGWGGKTASHASSQSVFIQRVLAWQTELGGKKVDPPRITLTTVPVLPTSSTVYLELDM